MNEAGSKGLAKREWIALSRRELLRGATAAGIVAAGAIATTASAEIWEEGEEQCRAQVPERDPTYDVDNELLVRFMEVSRSLTGMALASVSDLRLGRQYLERYVRIAELSDLLPELIKAHRNLASTVKAGDAVADALMKNDAVRPAAEQLIYLWYVSAFYLPLAGDPAKRLWIYGTTEQYERALLWSAVRAHAPMARAGRPGDWAHKPS